MGRRSLRELVPTLSAISNREKNMSQKSWHLDRRTFLRGSGVALALPLLESMSWAGKPAETRPRRLCCTFFANGAALPKEGHPDRKDWHWFPLGEGRDYRLTKSLDPLEGFRDDMTIIGGLSHPTSRDIVGHSTADVWLTGGDLRGGRYQNRISLDQHVAAAIGEATRIQSLVLSSNGGVGTKTRTSTISYDRRGEPIAAESMPRQIFERLFAPVSQNSIAQQRKALTSERRLMDIVLEDARSLRNRLSTRDQRKLDEYTESVHEMERRIDRAEAWLGRPRPNVDPKSLNLEATQEMPQEYLRTIFDLIVLSFRTDTTRVATFQTSQEDGRGISDGFPQIALGLGGHHGLSHGGGKGDGMQKWGQYDRFLTEQFAYFLARLKSIEEGDGNLLDHSLCLYGSATSSLHLAKNYPTILAGGRRLGLKHGSDIQYAEEMPMSNLLTTMLQPLGLREVVFADITGHFSELLT